MSVNQESKPAYMTRMRESFAKMHKILDRAAEAVTINDSDWHRRFDERLRALEQQAREAEHQLPLLDERTHQCRIGLVDAKSAIAEMGQQISNFIKPTLNNYREFNNLMIGRINRLEDRMDRKTRPYPTYDGPVIAEGDHAYLNREMRRAVDEFRRRVEAILEGCDPNAVPF